MRYGSLTEVNVNCFTASCEGYVVIVKKTRSDNDDGAYGCYAISKFCKCVNIKNNFPVQTCRTN